MKFVCEVIKFLNRVGGQMMLVEMVKKIEINRKQILNIKKKIKELMFFVFFFFKSQ